MHTAWIGNKALLVMYIEKWSKIEYNPPVYYTVLKSGKFLILLLCELEQNIAVNN